MLAVDFLAERLEKSQLLAQVHQVTTCLGLGAATC